MTYGIKSSEPGYDVKTAGVGDIVYTSEYVSHKIALTGTVTGTSTIAHGLGYSPFVELYVYDGTDVTKQYDLIQADATNIYIYITGTPYEKAFYVVFYEGKV